MSANRLNQAAKLRATKRLSRAGSASASVTATKRMRPTEPETIPEIKEKLSRIGVKIPTGLKLRKEQLLAILKENSSGSPGAPLQAKEPEYDLGATHQQDSIWRTGIDATRDRTPFPPSVPAINFGGYTGPENRG